MQKGWLSLKKRLVGIFLFLAISSWGGIDGDPLYEHSVQSNGASFFAIRPFYSHTENPNSERWRKDYLWPIYTRKGFQKEVYARFLFFGYSLNFSKTDDRHRNWVIPVWFQGVDSHGQHYMAIFPLGGTIHEILGRDKLMFILFPLYAKSQVNEVHSRMILWPVYVRVKGPKVDRLRIWPFYAHSTLAGEFEKKFILWPFYNSVKYTNNRNPGGGFIFFPFYGRVKTEKAINYWWIPPFFRYASGENQWILNLPWPFIQLADGDLEKRVFWPIYGKKHLGDLTRNYWLWPLIWNNKTEYLKYEQHRRYLLPFFAYRSKIATKTTKQHQEGEVFSRYWKLWPLMSWERRGEESRFRIFDFWILRNTAGIERNWAPWWTIYRREAKSQTIEHHLLWGLYRQYKKPETFEWSLLKGLVGYKKTNHHRSFRLLFIWMGEKPEEN